eukprot:GDKI01020622.1.p1 GENE.GDKI01020622.1~~GDKI01020622.1.p1  ORF type:complete len:392 (+),score=127.07 GDKI01020622.1:135-1178(+)
MQYGLLQWAVFSIMTVQRATHNSLIEFAKDGKKDFAFPAATIAWVSQVVCAIVGMVACYFMCDGWTSVKQSVSLKGCWYYSAVAFWYSFGDILEMEANRYVDSATYTVLSQSKLIITALLMIFMMSKQQSKLQWMILLVLTLGMGEYVCVGGNAGLSINGIGLALAKVVVSCYASVLCERAMKEDSSPFLVQFTQTKVVQLVITFVYFVVKDWDFLQSHNFNVLANWTIKAHILLWIGFVAKALLTQYLIKIMDSLLKNISEVAAMILVYLNKVFLLGGEFKMDAFVAALIVMFSVGCYVLSKEQDAQNEKEKQTQKKVHAEGDVEHGKKTHIHEHYLPLAGDQPVK